MWEGFCLLCLERSTPTWHWLYPFTGDNWKLIIAIITLKQKFHVNLMTCKISYATVKRSSLDFLTGRWLATHSCWLFLAKVCEWVHTYLHFSGSSFFFSPKSTYPCRHTASPAATLSTAVTCHFQNRQLTGQPDESALETQSSEFHPHSDSQGPVNTTAYCTCWYASLRLCMQLLL